MLIFVLLRKFTVELAVPVEDIGRVAGVVTHPHLRGDKNKDPSMPLVLRLIKSG